MGSIFVIRALLARMSPRTRRWLAVSVALGVVGRLSLVVLASHVADGATSVALQLGVVSAAVFAASRAAQSLVRVAVLGDTYAMTVRAVLAGDVVGVPTSDVRRAALEGSHHSVVLIGELTPAFAADIVTSLLLVPFLVGTFSLRILGIASVTLLVVLIAALLARAVAYRLEQRVSDSYGHVFDTLLGAIENRVEIVARAGERDFSAAFERQLAAHETLVRRLGAGSSMLGRAPLAAAAVAVLLVAGSDGASRSALSELISHQALVLAACVPAIHGALLGAHGMVRSLVLVRPLAELILRSREPEGGGSGETVAFPVVIRGDRVRFAYSPDGPPVLDEVSFVWNPGEPLVLVGPNGAGKSTLFKLLLGLRTVTSGGLRFGQSPLGALDLAALRRQTAYLPQRAYLGEAHVTVRSAMRLSAPGASDPAMHAALDRLQLLEALRASSRDPLDVPVGELSAGQRQRVALARVLLQDAKLVLLDEPDANLDSDGVALVARLADEMCEAGKMVAIAAHSPALAALSRAPLDLEKRRPDVSLRVVGGS